MIEDFFDNRLIALAAERMTTLADYKKLVLPVFTKPESIVRTDEDKKLIDAFMFNLQVEPWTKENILEAIRKTIKDTDCKGKDLYKLIYGQDTGLPLPEVIELMGHAWVMWKLY